MFGSNVYTGVAADSEQVTFFILNTNIQKLLNFCFVLKSEERGDPILLDDRRYPTVGGQGGKAGEIPQQGISHQARDSP